MRKILIILFILFISAGVALSRGNRFFEFAPDVSTALDIQNIETPSQPFLPLNDFLDGFDLWLANSGQSGTASFELRDKNNALLTSKTATIPFIPSKYGGTRFHFDFPEAVKVVSTKMYKLRIISTMPNLKLYKVSQFKVFQHNTQNYPDFVVEPALLGSESQNFTFKYALSEAKESGSPIISNTSTTIQSPTSVNITFNANEPVDYRVQFGPAGQNNTGSTEFKNSYQFCQTSSQPCSILIGVLSNTSYHYDLFAKDEWNNLSQFSGTFTTPKKDSKPLKKPPLAPSNLTANPLSIDKINISWRDNSNDEDGFVLEKSIDNKNFSVVEILPQNAVSKTVNNLAPNTLYYFRVKTFNSAGSSPYSNTGSAKTKKKDSQSKPPLAPSELTAGSISTSEINVSWKDNSSDETGFILEKSVDNKTFSAVETLPQNSTSKSVSNLTSGTLYYFRVQSFNSAGSSPYSNIGSAKTKKKTSSSESPPPGPPPPSRNSPPPSGESSPPPPPPSKGPGGSTAYANKSKTIKITVSPNGKDKLSENSITVEWIPPPNKNVKGYIVEIFDKQEKTTRKVAVSEETRKLIVEKLGPGRYRITVYANVGGKLEQLGEPIEIEIKLREPLDIFSTRNIIFLSILAVGLISGLIVILKTMRRRKTIA